MERMSLTEDLITMAFVCLSADQEAAREFTYEEREDGPYMVHPNGLAARARWATATEMRASPAQGILRFDPRWDPPGLVGARALGAGLRAIGAAYEALAFGEED